MSLDEEFLLYYHQTSIWKNGWVMHAVLTDNKKTLFSPKLYDYKIPECTIFLYPPPPDFCFVTSKISKVKYPICSVDMH